MAEESVAGIKIQIPSAQGGIVRIDAANGQNWSLPVGPLPLDLKADVVWNSLLDNWGARRMVIDAAGERLGKWLFGEAGGEALRGCVDAYNADGKPRRIALSLTGDAGEWPWEMLADESHGPLAAHHGLTLYRLAANQRRTTSKAGTLPRVHLVGVKLDPKKRGIYEDLATDDELERIVQVLKGSTEAQFDLEFVDPIGDWTAFRKRLEGGIPHVLHFAGHGLPEGRGLVFRDEGGGPVKIDAGQLASVLTGSRTGPCGLTVLSACETAANTRQKKLQPFGSLTTQLSAQGIDHVVAMQVPLVDTEARLFSENFYRALGRGCGVDVAVQRARRELMLHGQGLVSWAQLLLSVKEAPAPLNLPGAQTPNLEGNLDAFAFKGQRQALEELLGGNRSLVVVVHGRDRSGHRRVIDRVKRDLKHRRLLWWPFGAMRWSAAEDAPELVDQMLLGGLAAAFRLDTGGTEKELRDRVLTYLRGLPENEALVVDVESLLTPITLSEATAMVELVTKIWVDLIREVPRCTAFLLLSVAYPGNDDAKLRALGVSVVERLKKTPKLIPGQLRVEVLDELQPITKQEVERFLDRTYDLDVEVARLRAERIAMPGFDNERVFENLIAFMQTAGKRDKRREPPAAS